MHSLSCLHEGDDDKERPSTVDVGQMWVVDVRLTRLNGQAGGKDGKSKGRAQAPHAYAPNFPKVSAMPTLGLHRLAVRCAHSLAANLALALQSYAWRQPLRTNRTSGLKSQSRRRNMTPELRLAWLKLSASERQEDQS